MTQEDDASYKKLFSAPELVRDLILGFIPDEWLHGLDYSTLEKQPASYVTDDYRHRADDVVWRVKVDGEWVYLYILIEFQSQVDAYMAVRMMVYVGLLYQDLIARGEVLADKRLPPVLPIVLYNGGQAWTVATDIADLIPKVPGLVSDYLPQLRYLLIDEGRYAESELAGKKNLMAAVMRFENPQGEDALVELIDQLNDWLADKPELRRIFAIWIRAVLLRKTKSTLALPKVDDLKELKMTLAERFEEWAKAHEQRGMEKGMEKGIEKGIEKGRAEGLEKGMAKGLEKGRAQGEALLLQRQLVRRFGPLPPELTQQIACASVEQIEAWGERVLEAASLAEVFGREA
jgi:predicted transposase YdaD